MTDWLHEVTNRAHLMQLFGERDEHGSDIVEVGVEYGMFSQQIVELCPRAKLVAVDPWRYQTAGYQDPCNKPQAALDEIYRQCCERLQPYGDRVQILRMPSIEAAKKLEDMFFDLVYLDGNLEAWYPRVMPGGILAGHDFTENPNPTVCGVIPAVTELVARERLSLYRLFGNGDCSWAVRKPT